MRLGPIEAARCRRQSSWKRRTQQEDEEKFVLFLFGRRFWRKLKRRNRSQGGPWLIQLIRIGHRTFLYYLSFSLSRLDFFIYHFVFSSNCFLFRFISSYIHSSFSKEKGIIKLNEIIWRRRRKTRRVGVLFHPIKKRGHIEHLSRTDEKYVIVLTQVLIYMFHTRIYKRKDICGVKNEGEHGTKTRFQSQKISERTGYRSYI